MGNQKKQGKSGNGVLCLLALIVMLILMSIGVDLIGKVMNSWDIETLSGSVLILIVRMVFIGISGYGIYRFVIYVCGTDNENNKSDEKENS